MKINKKLDPAYLNHNTRVLTDSGTPGNGFLGNRNVEILKRGGLWNKCIYYVDGIDGKKIDNLKSVSKLYDLKNNGDLIQATGSSQPKSNVGGDIYFGGTQRLASDLLGVGNKIRDARGPVTVLQWVKRPTGTSAHEIFMSRYATGNFAWMVSNGAAAPYFDKLRVVISSNATLSTKLYYADTTPIFDNTWHLVGFTYDGNNNLNLIIDTITQTLIKTADTSMTTMVDTSTGISMGNTHSGGTSPYIGLSGASMMFDNILSADEIAYIVKNTHPDRKTSMFSTDTIAHINRVEADNGYVTDPNGVEFMYRKLEQYGLTNYCKLLSFIDGGYKNATAYSGNVSKVYNLKGTVTADDGEAAATRQPILTLLGNKLAINTVAVLSSAIPAGMLFGTNMQSVFNNKSKGAIICLNKRNQIPDANARVNLSGFRVSATLVTLIANTISASPTPSITQSAYRRVITGTPDAVKTINEGDDGVGIVKVSYADWANNNCSTYRNGVQTGGPTTISTAGNTSAINCEFVTMGGNFGNFASYGDVAIMAVFEGAFDVNAVAAFSIEIKKYYGV